ncbi:DUF397 domain-containing protein [Prauserella muralis]|uniref:DUF397 domain-containing protein n=1 Tax=Prauserella muralis TaxID=588067 RepID=A0A2V4BAB8_9PSEU|nr:DUF397 domain-containing protein [Prauserella muralis]PXY31442.1 DUF397 domain-containing protein [Prauserella muralis]TWE14222.1 uncharacterized protein DUF397 [Prauserella muralis]
MAEQIHNGISAESLSGAAWRKSKYSGSMGNCVEVAPLGDGQVAVRNSRDPRGPALIYTRAEIEAFLAGAKDGEFDDVVA